MVVIRAEPVDLSTLELAVKAIGTFSAMFLIAGGLVAHALFQDMETAYRLWLVDTVALVECWPQKNSDR